MKNIIIAVLILFVTSLLMIMPCEASEDHHEKLDNRPTNQLDGLDNVCAASTAISNIPAISHHSDHNSHTSIGAAIGACESKTGLALGINHHTKSIALRASTGTSGDVTTVGIGVSFGF